MASLKQLYFAVDRPTDLGWPQWQALYEFTIHTNPRLIVELGRGYGNSTCLFTEASQRINCRVVSIDWDRGNRRLPLGRAFERKTWPRVQPLVNSDWRRNLVIIRGNIMKMDFHEILGEDQRTLLFWDVHGEKLANFIISKIFPILIQREHEIAVHDIHDANSRDKYVRGNLASNFEELLPLADYLTEQRLKYTVHPTQWLHFNLNEHA